ncbi:MAG TPA: Gfo/Idh/MocA family oxidoreductase [Planctomycetota bacterium]|nr:Gfo/Idh/MocA family oxidoreductase [Planctomycetota bacterium]
MLGYGIIGCGRIFRNHAVSVQESPHARLLAVADVRREARERAADEFGVAAYATYDEMLKRPDIDVVSVCLPHHLHEPAVLAAAREGKHVLCEKPIALNREQAVGMIRECHNRGVKLGIVLQNRYNEASQKVLDALCQGRFGRLTAGSMVQAVHKEPAYYKDDWHGRWSTEGGGALLTQSIHTLDLLCLFLGRPTGVKAYFGTLVHEIEVEDVCGASLRFDNGALAGVAATNGAFKEWWQRIDLIGTQGTVTVEDNRIVRWEFADSRPEDATVGNEDSLEKSLGAHGYGTGHRRLIADFLSSIIEDRPFRISGEEALRVSEVIWAAYRSAESGCEEEVRDALAAKAV